MAKTLTEPNAEEQVIKTYNREMRVADRIVLELNTKYAICLLKLHPAVTPANYPAIGQAINAVPGVQGITLIIDHQTRASLPEGHELSAVIETFLRIDPIPEE